MISNKIYVGVDVGSSRTKVALLDSNKNLIGYSIEKSGTDFSAIAEECLESSLKMANASRKDIIKTISTGYGRKNVAYADESKTEIGCHAKGCYHYYPESITIVDIGGQDNKIIKLDANGLRTGFKMNRKCAAGTGAFLEEMAARLDIPLDDMDDLASRSTDMIKLGSFCTVFSATEVLENIRHGKNITDIVKGVFYSIIKRIIEMDSLTKKVIMTGGVIANNPYLVKMSEELIAENIFIPEHPQLTGAIGAALYAMENDNKRD